MPEYLTSGSAIERVSLCRASVALPHANHESEWTTRGTAIHSFLEDCSRVGRDAAISLVDEEFRGVCEELNLDGLHEQLSLAAEVALAYDCETDTARELGRGQGRAYDDVKDTEIPATLDCVGVRPVVRGMRGLVVDWKSGWSTRRKIDNVVQLDFGALCTARAYGCDVVEVQLVHVHEDLQPWVQRRIVEGWEIDAFASYVREIYREARELRELMKSGKIPTDFSTGAWCTYCPGREFCPAQTSLLRSVLRRDLYDGPLKVSPISDDALVDIWNQIHEAQGVLSLAKSKVMAIAANRTLHLGKTPTGLDRWLGKVRYEGNDKLDGEIVYDVLATMFNDDVASKATKVVATKKDVDAAIKGHVKKGQGAKNVLAAYTAIEKAGGITRAWKNDVKEYTTKQVLDESTPAALPAAPPSDDAASEFWEEYEKATTTPKDPK